ncbi:sigma-70 family RNA polymerase sigma factor [Cellulomonas sp. H30R-01]|uniref:sigma-70 family RNA polymerase sigma factor n=1 Tax=Cellulomonas sp. H30R-01 TaxID=2704467 RepID=UPI00138CFD22|nr:sigma-70 family RNA polymerase sigma factor [Cellulomonas sp. H30R-01]QHT56750.1 sigma-70 family RNA polymerase sigma factor [Cellulomonas sp. H30R-01]
MTWEDDLGRVVAERGGALVAYARLLTGDLHAAQDLVQDALVNAFTRRRRGPVDEVEAYVRRAILNAYLDGWRRRRRLDQVVHLVATQTHAADQTSAAGDRADVAAALDALSPRERACVVLRFYDDLTLPEIGHRLGVSDGAVKRYLSDARRRLEPLLGPQPDLLDDVPTIAKGARR